MVYQHPLAYLLGVQGLALMRAYAGEHDRAFTEERIAEVRRLLDHPALNGEGVTATASTTVDVYRVWSRTYDDPGNGCFDADAPYVHGIVDALPPGDALDAACGTGRHSEYLAKSGHRVIGVDGSPDMLERARARVPEADFREGELSALPMDDESVDLVVCTLALTHVPDLKPVFAEFARVLRPGGHLVIVDVHHLLLEFGSQPRTIGPDGERLLSPGYVHYASDYLGAALPLGLMLVNCEEPRGATAEEFPPAPEDVELGDWTVWPWSLMELAPAATAAAWSGRPSTVNWHFRAEG